MNLYNIFILRNAFSKTTIQVGFKWFAFYGIGHIDGAFGFCLRSFLNPIVAHFHPITAMWTKENNDTAARVFFLSHGGNDNTCPRGRRHGLWCTHTNVLPTVNSPVETYGRWENECGGGAGNKCLRIFVIVSCTPPTGRHPLMWKIRESLNTTRSPCKSPLFADHCYRNHNLHTPSLLSRYHHG